MKSRRTGLAEKERRNRLLWSRLCSIGGHSVHGVTFGGHFGNHFLVGLHHVWCDAGLDFLKRSVEVFWFDGGNGIDEYGFNGLPGGLRSPSGSFSNVTQGGYWWMSEGDNEVYAYDFYLKYNYDWAERNMNPTSLGHSVRCIKD